MFSAIKAISMDTAFWFSLCAWHLRGKPSNIHHHFAKRTQIEKLLNSCLSIRNEIFRANLAQKTNPKRTHFSSNLSHSFLPLRFENFSGAWRLVFGNLPSSFFHSLSSSDLVPPPTSTLRSVCEWFDSLIFGPDFWFVTILFGLPVRPVVAGLVSAVIDRRYRKRFVGFPKWRQEVGRWQNSKFKIRKGG